MGPDIFAISLSPTVGSGTQWSSVLCNHLREGESTRDQADSFGGSGAVAAATVVSVVIQRRDKKSVAGPRCE